MTLSQPPQLQFTVGAQRQEVMFKDGTTITLHPVFEAGVQATYLRAVRTGAGLAMVLDLRTLVPQIGADICTAQTRDVPGIVFYTLRHAFATSELVLRQFCTKGRALYEHNDSEHNERAAA